MSASMVAAIMLMGGLKRRVDCVGERNVVL